MATDDQGLADRIRMLRLHGMSKDAADRYQKQYRHWDMVELGQKANLPDILAALLIPQIERLPEYLARREELARKYEAAFAGVPEVGFPRAPAGSVSARHLFTIWAPRRDLFLQKLQEKGIGVAVNYRAVHLLSYYRERFAYKPGDFPLAEYIGDHTLSLPLYPKLSDQEADRVISAVAETAEELANEAAGRRED